MQEQPKKKSRHEWVSKMKKNEKGKLVYTGSKYYYEGTGKERGKKLVFLGILCLAALSVNLGAGFVPVPGLTGSPYVLIPYAVCLLCSIGMCWQTVNLVWGGEPINDFEFESVDRNYKIIAGIGVAAAVASMIGEGIYLIIHGAGEAVSSAVIFYVCAAAAILVYRLLIRTYSGMHWTLKEK